VKKNLEIGKLQNYNRPIKNGNENGHEKDGQKENG